MIILDWLALLAFLALVVELVMLIADAVRWVAAIPRRRRAARYGIRL